MGIQKFKLEKMTEEQQKLAEKYMPLVKKICGPIARIVASRTSVADSKVASFDQHFQELVAEGYLGLCLAAQRYRESGASFMTYAYRYIRGFAILHMRRCKLSIGHFRKYLYPLEFSVLDEGVGHAYQTPANPEPFQVYDVQEIPPEGMGQERLTNLLTTVLEDDLHLKIMTDRLSDDVKTYEEIGKEIGMSKEGVRQVVDKCFRKMRENPDFVAAIEESVMESNQREKHDTEGFGVPTRVSMLVRDPVDAARLRSQQDRKDRIRERRKCATATT